MLRRDISPSVWRKPAREITAEMNKLALRLNNLNIKTELLASPETQHPFIRLYEIK